MSRHVVLALLLSLPPAGARGASFQGLGDLPGGPFSSSVGGVSADGSVVVGSSAVDEGIPFVCDDTAAFRWTAAGGMVAVTPDHDRWYGHGVSADGSTVVGFGGPGHICTNWVTFRWTEAAGHETLPFFGDATAASADGGVVVGTARTQQGDRAVRWTPLGGSQSLGALGSVAGNPASHAADVSDDGALIAGVTSTETRNTVPFRWTAASGMQALADIEGRAQAVSPEGSCIAGRAAFGGPEHQAFLWTADGGFLPLPYLPGGPVDPPPMWVSDVSRGCQVVVGNANSGANSLGFEAFVWSGRTGMRRVSELLAEQGVDVGDWELYEAVGVSADGATIVGTGVDPDGFREAWIAQLPEPSGAAVAFAVVSALGVLGATRCSKEG